MEKKNLIKLVKKASKGDMAAFEELYQAKLRSILYHANTILKNEHDAQDAAQEVAISMYRSLGDLRDPKVFDGWMHRIVTNVCYKILNKKPKQGEVDVDLVSDKFVESDKTILPHEYVEYTDDKAYIRSVIDSMPTKRRQAIIMYYYDDMSYKEIASALGSTISTVSTNIVDAKKMMRDKLEKRRGKDEAVSGMAIAPLITSALNEDAERLFPDEVLTGISKNVHSSIREIEIAEKITASRNNSIFKSPTTIVTCVVSASIIIATALCFVFVGIDPESNYGEDTTLPVFVGSNLNKSILEQIKDAENIDSDEQTQNEGVHVGKVAGAESEDENENTENLYNYGEIICISDSCGCGHVNPTEIHINNPAAKATNISWFITDASESSIIYSGTGTYISSELTNLYESRTDGFYTVFFTYNDKDGNLVGIKRVVLIDSKTITENEYE